MGDKVKGYEEFKKSMNHEVIVYKDSDKTRDIFKDRNIYFIDGNEYEIMDINRTEPEYKGYKVISGKFKNTKYNDVNQYSLAISPERYKMLKESKNLRTIYIYYNPIKNSNNEFKLVDSVPSNEFDSRVKKLAKEMNCSEEDFEGFYEKQD